jgi:multidrug efflux pump subunit AcrA (membrane-fusion protein)
MVAGAILILGLVIPWPLTVLAPFTVVPALSIPITAPDSGVVDQVLVREGTRASPGALLLRIRNLTLEREAAGSRRIVDSLAARSLQAEAGNRTAEVAQLDLARTTEQARLAGLRERIGVLELRALSEGVVLTPRIDELAGQWVRRGAVVLELGRPDSVEIRIALSGAGDAYVKAGQSVRLLPESDRGRPIESTVQQVATAADARHQVEARLRVRADDSWRPGVTGRASIRLRRSNLWGALLWRARQQIRSDILL